MQLNFGAKVKLILLKHLKWRRKHSVKLYGEKLISECHIAPEVKMKCNILYNVHKIIKSNTLELIVIIQMQLIAKHDFLNNFSKKIIQKIYFSDESILVCNNPYTRIIGNKCFSLVNCLFCYVYVS